ncbi:MAG: hypothetical protein ACTSR8_08575 [Promethearchaeota archaeon]
MDERFAKVDERFAKVEKRFETIEERISKNQEILISHSKSLEYIMKNMPNLQNLKDIDLRMTRLENLSSTNFKTLNGKIDTKFNEVNKKLDAQKEDIIEIKKLLTNEK